MASPARSQYSCDSCEGVVFEPLSKIVKAKIKAVPDCAKRKSNPIRLMITSKAVKAASIGQPKRGKIASGRKNQIDRRFSSLSIDSGKSP
jgi:hypothetical protein